MRPSWVVKMIEGGNPEIDDENDEQAEHKRKKSDQSDGDEEPKNQRKRLSKKTPDDQPRDGAIDRPMPKFQTIGECEKFEVKWSDELFLPMRRERGGKNKAWEAGCPVDLND